MAMLAWVGLILDSTGVRGWIRLDLNWTTGTTETTDCIGKIVVYELNVQKAGWVQYVQSCGKNGGTLLERKGWTIQRRQVLTEKRMTDEWISTRKST